MMRVYKLTVIGFAAFVVLIGMLAVSAGQADANLADFSFSKAFGSFTKAESIAVDESTGDVYVYDVSRSAIEKFDAEGNPVDFSALSSNEIEGIDGRQHNEAQIAVDNSSGSARGDIYVATGNGVSIYGANGQRIGELSSQEGDPWGEPCGVGVDSHGVVYVGLYYAHVNRYTPNANPVTDADYTGSLTELEGVCNVGADGEGSVYVDEWKGGGGGPVIKYESSQFGEARAVGTQVLAEGGGTLAVARSFGGELFADTRSEIRQYDTSGGLLSAFGASGVGSFSESLGVGIDTKTGKLYVSNPTSGTVEIWQGSILPGAQTGQPTNLSLTGTATLNGSVGPEGTAVGTCAFEYGSTSSYGSLATCAQTTPLTGSEPVTVSAAISGVLLNTVYHYRLVATNENGSGSGTDKTFVILVLPTVEDQPPAATSITRSSAELTGTIDPNQGDTRYHFEIGTTEAYGHITPVAHIDGGVVGDATVNQQVGELLPNTTYHYRLVAGNLAGVAIGGDHTFKTGAPTPPAAVTGGGGGVAENSATIAGVVNTKGLPTTYGFEIGTSTDYGPATGLGSVGAGLSEVPVSLSLSGLQPGTVYHYRITATNVDGTSYGIDQTFTTGVFASTFAEPPAPLPFVVVPSTAFPGEPKPGIVKKTAKSKAKKIKKRSKAKGKKKSKTKKKK